MLLDILIVSIPTTSTNFAAHAEVSQEKSQHGEEEAHIEVNYLNPVKQ